MHCRVHFWPSSIPTDGARCGVDLHVRPHGHTRASGRPDGCRAPGRIRLVPLQTDRDRVNTLELSRLCAVCAANQAPRRIIVQPTPAESSMPAMPGPTRLAANAYRVNRAALIDSTVDSTRSADHGPRGAFAPRHGSIRSARLPDAARLSPRRGATGPESLAGVHGTSSNGRRNSGFFGALTSRRALCSRVPTHSIGWVGGHYMTEPAPRVQLGARLLRRNRP